MSASDKLTEQQIKDMLIRIGIRRPSDQQIQDTINRLKIKIPSDQQISDMQIGNKKVTPTENQVKDMERRIGVIPTGNFDDTKKSLNERVRLRPNISQKLLGMIKEDYELFGVEPSENL